MNILKKDMSKVGQTDYIDNNGLHSVGTASAVMISNESELAELLKHYPPGTLAYTAGFKAMWQLNAAGAWVSMI